MNKITGRPRQKLKGTIRSMKNQQSKGLLSEVEILKIKDLEHELKLKK